MKLTVKGSKDNQDGVKRDVVAVLWVTGDEKGGVLVQGAYSKTSSDESQMKANIAFVAKSMLAPVDMQAAALSLLQQKGLR